MFNGITQRKKYPLFRNSNQIIENRFPFTPEILIGAKIKDGDFHIYHGGFGEVGRYKARVADMYEIFETYDTIGSGDHYASLVLKQQNRLYESLGNNLSQLPLEINIGLACYMIDEIKTFDKHTGEYTQISKINNNGYFEISLDEQAECYNKMINNLSTSLRKEMSSDGDVIKILKKILPVTRTRPL